MHPLHLATLENLGLLAITGKDAASFLQGYITTNADGMSNENWQQGAFCNIQGRMVSSYLMTGDAVSGFLLRLDSPLVAATIEFLSKYILFAKAASTDVSADFNIIGVWGENADTELSKLFPNVPDAVPSLGGHRAVNGVHLARLPGPVPRFELWLPNDQPSPLAQTDVQIADADSWHLMDIQSGIGHVTAPIAEKLIPQMMNYQAISAIDFDKGCYLGQEIIARMQYRGELKQRMFRASSQVPSTPGDSIFDQNGKPAGFVVSCAKSSGSYELLAVLRQAGNQFFQAEEGTALEILDLPYTLPSVDP